jgi:non-lysosomal glucosylceramidase
MKVLASSIEKNNPEFRPENVLNDEPTSRWSSVPYQDPQWIYIDAEKTVEFNVVTIIWETAFGEKYEIQISDDAKEWKTIYKEDKGAGGTDKIYVGKQKARYVRMFGIKHGASWGFSIFRFKFELLDDGAAPARPDEPSAVSGDEVVFLDWDKTNSEDDFHGYNVYKSENENGPYKKINNIVLTNTQFKDSEVANAKDYYYQLKAVDYPQNESEPSKAVKVTPEAESSISEEKKHLFDIPECAWSRYLGDIPYDCYSSSPDRGIALGGFGAGSFMYSLSGAFGPWALKVAGYFEDWLDGGAFHLWEKSQGDTKVKCLSSSKKLKKSWDKLKPGEGRYFALQPVGWTSYNSFKANVESEFFSPIIAHNYKETSYPVALWQWKFFNPTDEEIELSLMFSWSQPPFEYQKREGFNNQFKEKDNIKGVVLKANSPKNTPETENTEWALAAKCGAGIDFSYVDSWDNKADGGDLWDDFKEDGRLSNKKLDESNSGAAICLSIKLQPKEEKSVPLALSWDYPLCEFSAHPKEGTKWYKKYTEFFSKEGNMSFEIAKESLERQDSLRQEVSNWMNPVINDEKYPTWLKTTAFNELYYSQFGGCFYEGGLKEGHDGKYLNKRPDSSRHFILECMMYRYCSTFDVRHYSSIVYAKLWPEIEKETLLSWTDAVLNDDPEHQVPHDCGGPWGDPYFAWDDYGTNQKHWKDLHSKFIQQIWRYYYLYKDEEFLKYAWEACKATYGYMKKTDTDGDGLPNNSGSDNTYDAWGLWGTSLLCGGLWVGALEAMKEIATILKDPIIDEVKELLLKARENLDKKLWHEKGGYYKIDTESKHPTAIMADGLNGQRYCECYGLADILPKEKLVSHLKQVYERNVVPLKDFNGDGVGDCGAINGIKEDGGYIGSLEQAEEIWTGSSYYLSASMYHAGLKEEALKTAYGVYYITYLEESTAYWFNTPEAWRDGGIHPRPTHPEQYQRPRAVWELVFEINDPYKK